MSTEKKKTDEQNQQEEGGGEGEEGLSNFIYADALEEVLSHVPLLDLVPASHVSRSWNHAVFSSLRHVNRLKPWLIIHEPRRRPPFGVTVRAYDPRSHVWIEMVDRRPMPEHLTSVPLRSSHSPLLYALSGSKFSFSVDPLHLAWRHVDAPRVWRMDPVVAQVGGCVVVAGGACDFEDDHLAVEILDIETGVWSTSRSMPQEIKDYAAATWLSVAANTEKIYVAEKRSGTAFSFDPYTGSWIGPFSLRPDGDEEVCTAAICFLGDRLIMVGVTGDEEDTEEVKVWDIAGDSSEKFKLIGVMPKACLEKLKGESCVSALSSISVNAMGNLMYIHNEAEAGEIVVAEMVEGSIGGWRSVANVAASERSVVASRLVFTCSNVGLGDLRRALREEECAFRYFHD